MKRDKKFMDEFYQYFEDMFEYQRNPTRPRDKMHKKRFDNCESRDECEAPSWSRCTQMCWGRKCIVNKRRRENEE